ncbi:hypothetical protein, partial [Streptomyces sp. NPDC056045]|uniref:hypothetical protein n=1 Tax=Streptomyces sp. NPDC056045 TaxID=3345691 RepID=UPI0035E0643C
IETHHAVLQHFIAVLVALQLLQITVHLETGSQRFRQNLTVYDQQDRLPLRLPLFSGPFQQKGLASC